MLLFGRGVGVLPVVVVRFVLVEVGGRGGCGPGGRRVVLAALGKGSVKWGRAGAGRWPGIGAVNLRQME
jgi:hypothetical protein